MNKDLEYSIAKFITTGEFKPGLLMKVAGVTQGELENRFPLHVDKVREFVLRTGLYWWDRERVFRPNRMEMESGSYTCPRCKESMTSQIYKFKGKLLRCPSCHWSIRFNDLWEEGRGKKSREVPEIDSKPFSPESNRRIKGRGRKPLTGDPGGSQGVF